MGFFRGNTKLQTKVVINNSSSKILDNWKQNHKNCVEYLKKYAYPENIDLVYDTNSNTINFKDDNRIQYFYSKLNIIRINSTIDIPLGTVEYIDNIITNGDLPSFDINDENDNGLSTLYPNGNPYTMSELKKFIPIFLVDGATMPEEFNGEKIKHGNMEYLGVYFSQGDGKFCNSHPCIYLCPERIEKAKISLSTNDKLRYAIVLIHELAHSLMDPSNYPTVDDDGFVFPRKCNNFIKPEDYHINEEKWANRIMLNYIQRVENNKYGYAEEFTRNQPDGYKLAADAVPEGWRDWYKEKNHLVSENWIK